MGDNRTDLTELAIFDKLIDIKWQLFGRIRHITQFLIYIFFVIIWSVIATTLPKPDGGKGPPMTRGPPTGLPAGNITNITLTTMSTITSSDDDTDAHHKAPHDLSHETFR